MNKRLKIVFGVAAGAMLIAFAGLSYVTKNEAHNLIPAPMDDERNLPDETPPITVCRMRMSLSYQTD